jgi:predicted nucleic acid-binding protein
VILVDTSVWIDHFRHGDVSLSGVLQENQVLVHDFVIGELALGSLRQYAEIRRLLLDLPHAPVATSGAVLEVIGRFGLSGTGVGYVDVHLLTATLARPGTLLWTRDRRRCGLAGNLSVAADMA